MIKWSSYLSQERSFMIKVLLLASFILQIIGIVDCLKSNKPINEKIPWILVLFFLSYIGVACYYLIGKKS